MRSGQIISGTNPYALLRDDKLDQWFEFKDPAAVYQTSDLSEINSVLNTIDRRVRDENLTAVGWLAYEAASAFDPALATKSNPAVPLLYFALFKECNAASPPEKNGPSPLLFWQNPVDKKSYCASLKKIRGYLKNGDTYQVNYTFKMASDFAGDPYDLFCSMLLAHQPGYPLYLATEDWVICSASPELFFSLNHGTLVSKPMKGTRPRGITPEADFEVEKDLQSSEKDKAENLMIVDMIRNDMGRIAAMHSVKASDLFGIEKYPNVYQMTSTVTCETNATVPEIFRALFPCASVTGAPKPRTMEIIRELESEPRGVYTGAIGFWTAERAQFNVAIRTVCVDMKNGRAEYGTGSGIVWDSDPAKEFEECVAKTSILSTDWPDFSLYETVLWTPEDGYFLLDYHLARLRRSTRYWNFPWYEEVAKELFHEMAALFPQTPQRVWLYVDRDGNFMVDHKEMKEDYSSLLRLSVSEKPVDPSNRFLYHKTTNREFYEDYTKNRPGCGDVILWNPRGEMTEITRANVVVKMKGQWFTPPVSCGLLPGTHRAFLLDQGKIKEKIIKLDDLKTAEAIAIINSVRKWQTAVLV